MDFMGTHRIDSPVHAQNEITNRLPVAALVHNGSTTSNGYDTQLNESWTTAQQPKDLGFNQNDQMVGK